MIKEKFAKLIDVKSFVTLLLVSALAFLVIYSAITGKHYYGTQKRPEDVPLTTQPGCYLLPNAKTEQEESESPD
jgi:hypothetical protein